MKDVPDVPTNCVVPRKLTALLFNGDKRCEVEHTIVVVEAGDPDGVLEYYNEKDAKEDFEGSDAEEEGLPTWGV